MERKHYIDNIRSLTIILVIIYHVFYIFNSAGVVSNIPIKGFAPFDIFCYAVYPWMMCIMFLIAGISLRYSVQKRDNKTVIKTRVQKLIIPYFGGMFALAWINGFVTSRYIDMFGGQQVPLFVRYIIYCQNIGPLWFLLELFLGTLILLLIRKIDSKDTLYNLCGKINIWGVLLLVLPVWGASHILNTPVMVVFRNGIYWLMILLGYYIFSQEKVLNALKKYSLPLGIGAVVLAVINVCFFWTKSFTSDNCLMHPLTNAYLWVAILAILGASKKHLDYTNKGFDFLKSRSFAYYILHYPFMILIAYSLVTFTDIPMIAVYGVLLVLSATVTVIMTEIIKKMPVLKYALLGIKEPNPMRADSLMPKQK